MRIGLQIPDFTWPGGAPSLGPDLARVASEADTAGFEYLAVMDHFFQIPVVGPADHDMLEAYTTLGFLAAHTNRTKLLTVITGVHYRAPGLLAKIVTTLDVLSGGRAMLGIGAGWNEEESHGLGFDFPPLAARFERLEETLRLVLQMWSGDDSPFDGKHIQATRPLNVPQSLSRPHPPIMVGGGGERKTLRLVAQYAQACNLFDTPELPHKLDVLRRHCDDVGRDYDEITKTAYLVLDAGSQGERTQQLLDDLRRLRDLGIDDVIGGIPNVATPGALDVFGAEIIPEASRF